MLKIKKICLLIISLFIVSNCTINENNKNEFQEIYDIKTELVKRITYDEFSEFIKSETGVIFIGGETSEDKALAKVFSESICKCGKNESYYLKTGDISNNNIKEILDIEDIYYPIILIFKEGELIKHYNNEIKAKDVEKVAEDIDYIINESDAKVCTDSC